MNSQDEKALRRWWYHLQLEAQTIETEKPLVDQVVVAARQYGVADALATVGMEGMAHARDIAKQHLDVLTEKLEIELAHADIDGTLVHSKDCDEGRPDCSCGAMQEAQARAAELAKQGRPVRHEALSETTARITAVIGRPSSLITDHMAEGDGIDCSHCGAAFSRHLRRQR